MTSRSGGALFALEGPDGVGKSTIHAMLAALLESEGRDVLALAFPGRGSGTLGEAVYQIHHDKDQRLPPLALQALHVAAHVDALLESIHPAITLGKVVLLDRSWWSTEVYARAQGVPSRHLDPLIEFEMAVWGPLRPTRTFLIRRSRPFRPEDIEAVHRQLMEAYDEVAARSDHPVSIVENGGDLEIAVSRVATEIREALAEVG